ncbi:MAG TPA: universal stress protein [Candidatus Tectomicrobia bacterium]|jgi:nucleotide-binding universal stress UspA family protein
MNGWAYADTLTEPQAGEYEPVPRVIAAIDGSVCSARALQVASRLAVTIGAQIGLVHVLNPKLTIGSGVPMDQMWSILRREGQELLDTAAASVPAHPHPWKFLRQGQPAKEIMASACEWSATLLVLGTHGRSGITRLLLGSTAETVLRHAPCPVVVVPISASVPIWVAP